MKTSESSSFRSLSKRHTWGSAVQKLINHF
jgi:hypothetical protein